MYFISAHRHGQVTGSGMSDVLNTIRYESQTITTCIIMKSIVQLILRNCKII